MQLVPGAKLSSIGLSVEIVVIRGGEAELACQGAQLAPDNPVGDQPAADPGDAPRVLIGKRYHDPVSGVEVLCTRAGAGPLTADGREMAEKSAKTLPSSD